MFLPRRFCRRFSREGRYRAGKGSCSGLSRSPLRPAFCFRLSNVFSLLFCEIDRGERVDERGEAAFEEREETAEERQGEER